MTIPLASCSGLYSSLKLHEKQRLKRQYGFWKSIMLCSLVQENEVFNMYASSSYDLTGIKIMSHKPLGVFTGADNVEIPIGNVGYDAIAEQV